MDIIFYVIVLFFIIIAKVLKSRVKGRIGEIKAEYKLNHLLDEHEYKVLNDLYLKTKYGTTQIDHVVVSKYGIFVIETKYYSGKIYGSEYAEYWTQYLPNVQNKLYNPIKQNLTHIKVLAKLIEIETLVYPVSIIAIKNSTTIKVNSQTPVIKISNLGNEIKKYNTVVLSQKQVNAVYNIIKKNNILDPEIRKVHSIKVKEYVKNKKGVF